MRTPWGMVHKCGELEQHETHKCVHVYQFAFAKNKDLYASNTLLYIIVQSDKIGMDFQIA